MISISGAYFYGAEAEQFSFFRVPKQLITDPRYKQVSTEAKLLYGLLLDRMELSRTNGWLDDQDRVYIYYTVEAISDDLNCGRDKAMKMLAELEDKAELIERVRQGRGKPSRIYVKKFIDKKSACPNKKSKKSTSRSRKSRPQEVGNIDPNNTDKNKTEMNQTESSIYLSDRSRIEEQVKKQISYDYLQEQYPYDDVDSFVGLISDILCSTTKEIKVAGNRLKTADVIKRFTQLDHSHVEYVIESLSKTETRIKNMRSYLITALYNSPLTIGQYYYAAAKADMKGRSP